MRFAKPSLTLDQQLDLLNHRGLVVPDRERARRYLGFIGYYRLSGYMLRFQSGGRGDRRHNFSDGVTFDDVLDDYVFDRRLRLLTMDALERIEVAVKAVIFNELAEQFGSHWYMDASVFRSRMAHRRFVDEVREATGAAHSASSHRRTPFLNHYFGKYDSPPLPPGAGWSHTPVQDLPRPAPSTPCPGTRAATTGPAAAPRTHHRSAAPNPG